MKISITKKETKEALCFILERFVEAHDEWCDHTLRDNIYEEELKIAKKIIKKLT